MENKTDEEISSMRFEVLLGNLNLLESKLDKLEAKIDLLKPKKAS
ncbi:MAG: hypothetical protein US88_C0002G0030 [Parcubacteria group bacterium GW2011_GWA2_38_27]|nr:MAG: hypothetical protein US88_C0002G0030 [Parcubacteria group bacterium GW2011_GWA2_38_27]